jgi:predicted glycosyltransferase
MGLNMAPDDTPLKSINQYSLRVLLYSHDSVGLGHLRRNLAIASEITAKFENASVMIVTGSSCATQFVLPRNTDLIKIPTIGKNDTGDYVTDSFGGSLQVTLTYRSKMILEAFRSFEPHLVIVDHQLTGLKGEAMAMLREAKTKETLLFFGMRDIKDGAEAVRRAWDNDDCRWALNECYDQVCVYGMQEVFDEVGQLKSLCLRGLSCAATAAAETSRPKWWLMSRRFTQTSIINTSYGKSAVSVPTVKRGTLPSLVVFVGALYGSW